MSSWQQGSDLGAAFDFLDKAISQPEYEELGVAGLGPIFFKASLLTESNR
ncbi:hypothetical protein AB0E01_10860 [Nocardia vinacea]